MVCSVVTIATFIRYDDRLNLSCPEPLARASCGCRIKN